LAAPLPSSRASPSPSRSASLASEMVVDQGRPELGQLALVATRGSAGRGTRRRPARGPRRPGTREPLVVVAGAARLAALVVPGGVVIASRSRDGRRKLICRRAARSSRPFCSSADRATREVSSGSGPEAGASWGEESDSSAGRAGGSAGWAGGASAGAGESAARKAPPRSSPWWPPRSAPACRQAIPPAPWRRPAAGYPPPSRHPTACASGSGVAAGPGLDRGGRLGRRARPAGIHNGAGGGGADLQPAAGRPRRRYPR